MNTIKKTFFSIFFILTGAWLLADTLIPEPFNYFSFRHVFVQYSGVIGIAMMSIGMILATRPLWLEKPLKGLDKFYRLHKWLGIGGLVFAVSHWWFAKGTKWMVDWGWLVKPEKKPRPEEILPTIEAWFKSQHGIAKDLGEWAFYIGVVLIAVALIKLFPYKLFRKTHTLLALVYLVLAYHSFILINMDYWSQPIGWLMAVLLIGGTISALAILLGRVGKSRKHHGTIKALSVYPDANVIQCSVEIDSDWPGHTPGQFAFVTSKSSEGPHPYTIASAWNKDEGRLTFMIKQLGDWTGQLDRYLKLEMPVTVEGPYGQFDFNDEQPQQIWVGAGIGITPFIARMKHLATHPGRQKVHLFYNARDFDLEAMDNMVADAKAAGITLYFRLTSRHGRLSADDIRKAVTNWTNASIWFCGPTEFGQNLRQDFVKNGLFKQHFHQELFEMR